MKKNKNWLFLILGLVLLLGLGQAAQAALVGLGPPDPNTTSRNKRRNFWVSALVFGYQRPGSGTLSPQCRRSKPPAPAFRPRFPYFRSSFRTNFPDEIFYCAA